MVQRISGYDAITSRTAITDNINLSGISIDDNGWRSLVANVGGILPKSFVITVHHIEIETNRLRPGRTRVTDRDTQQEWIAATREPFFATARLLHDLGAPDTDRLEMYRSGRDTPDMVGTIGGARGLTVIENDKAEPRLSRFKPHPCRGPKRNEYAAEMLA